MQKVVIATRGSALALWQAEHIKSKLMQEHKSLEVELLVLKTKGDIILDVPLAKVGGKGLFVKEIEEALLDGRADIAVHSMKDVPMQLPQGLILAAIPEREILSDVFLSAKYKSLNDLPQGAILGTSSLRRQAQVLALRPDLEIRFLRGNVGTRLNKMIEGQYDAIVLASAGLKRLGLSAPYQEEMSPPAFLPAAGQGALGIEIRADDKKIADLIAFLDHKPTRICVEAERAFLTALEGGCQVPIAAHATLNSNGLSLEGLVAEPDATSIIREKLSGEIQDRLELGKKLADMVLAKGGRDILEKLYQK